MNTPLKFLFLILLFSACKNHAPTKTMEQTIGDSQTSPNSCKIEATIIKVLNPSLPDRNDICHRYACEAIVHIHKIIRCGQAVTLTTDEQDKITLHFAYTLNATDSLYPTLKPAYPGLHNGSRFSANVEQRLVPGENSVFVVYGYEVH